MKKALEIVLTILAIGAMIGGCVYLYDAVGRAAAPATSQNVGGGFDISNSYYLSAGGTGAGYATTTPGEASATTTVLYFSTASATSTITGYIGRADKIDLSLLEVASTTSTAWLYTVQFSHNYVSSTGNGDWFNEDCSSISSNTLVTHGATACIHSWTPGTTATLKKNIGIGATQAKWFRVNVWASAAGGSLWGQAIPSEPTPN